jgi:voltage-gated potassium channel
MSITRRLSAGVAALLTIIAVGVIGYTFIEGWTFLDALYMTIITITTVGYFEVHPLSVAGRIFTIFLIIGGVGGAFYTLVSIVQYVVEGHFGTTLGRRRMKTRIAQLKEHFILCGFGRVGEEIARTFKEEGVPFVVVDNRPDCIARLTPTEYLYVEGDATGDEVLREAGVERARGLVSAVGTDADNIYITLSARGLRPDLFILARASSEEAATKLQRAGADRIVSPYNIGARRMAMLALRPAVVDFIDTVVSTRGREMQLEKVDAGRNSPLVGMTVKSARTEMGITVLAMQRKDGKLLPNPADEETIKDEDQLIVIGTKVRLAALEKVLEEAGPNR